MKKVPRVEMYAVNHPIFMVTFLLMISFTGQMIDAVLSPLLTGDIASLDAKHTSLALGVILDLPSAQPTPLLATFLVAVPGWIHQLMK